MSSTKEYSNELTISNGLINDNWALRFRTIPVKIKLLNAKGYSILFKFIRKETYITTKKKTNVTTMNYTRISSCLP